MKIKKAIKKFIPQIILEYYNTLITKYKSHLEIEQWLKSDRKNSPPPAFKQKIVKEIAKNNKIQVLIETGTYKGEMVDAQKWHFKKIYSIELDNSLFEIAKLKFKKYKHIYLFKGDSTYILPQILLKINEKALFWLDAHYDFTPITAKGEEITPILNEIETISNSKINHIILIDDARLFDGISYPEINDFLNKIKKLFPNKEVYIKNDIIHII